MLERTDGATQHDDRGQGRQRSLREAWNALEVHISEGPLVHLPRHRTSETSHATSQIEPRSRAQASRRSRPRRGSRAPRAIVDGTESASIRRDALAVGANDASAERRSLSAYGIFTGLFRGKSRTLNTGASLTHPVFPEPVGPFVHGRADSTGSTTTTRRGGRHGSDSFPEQMREVQPMRARR